MPRGRKSQGVSAKPHPPEEPPPQAVAPPRKHPLLLAVIILAMIGWLAFLAALALRG